MVQVLDQKLSLLAVRTTHIASRDHTHEAARARGVHQGLTDLGQGEQATAIGCIFHSLLNLILWTGGTQEILLPGQGAIHIKDTKAGGIRGVEHRAMSYTFEKSI